MTQEVWIDADGNIRAKNRSQFMGVYKGEAFDISDGFIYKMSIDWINADKESAVNYPNYCRYWGNTIVIELGNFTFVVKNAYHEYFNGACPVTFFLYEDFHYDHPGKSSADNDGDNSDLVIAAEGTLIAEAFTDIWAVNGVVNDEVVDAINGELTIKYDGRYISVTCGKNGDTIVWENWDGSTAEAIEVDSTNFEECDFIIGKGWGGYRQSEEGHAYLTDLQLQKGTPKTVA